MSEGEHNMEEIKLIAEVEEIDDMEPGVPKKKRGEENEIKEEVKPHIKETNIEKSEDVSSRLVDLFQQPFVIDHFLNHVKEKSPVWDYSTQSENENETMVSPKCVCRLCTKTDKTIYMKLFHGDNTMTPIANKIVYLIGEDKIGQDLLPQQICLGCSEMVESSYNALRQFSESHQILSDVVAEVRNKSHLFFNKNGNKKGSLYLKISDKDYEFSSSLETITALEERARTGKSSTNSSSSIKCFVCMECFASEDSLKSHTSEVHGCKIDYKCASCNTTFPTFAELRVHVKISTVCDLRNMDTEVEHLSGNENTDDFFDNNDTNDHIVCEDDFRKSENQFSTINDDIILNDASAYESNPIIRKKQIVSEYYVKILKRGLVESRCCNYCDMIFKSTFTDEFIKLHVLTHLVSDSSTKESIDIITLDIGQHTGTKSCYVCPICKIPKVSPGELRLHLTMYCSELRKKYNLKPMCKRKTRTYCCITCNDDTPYFYKEFKLHIKENHPELAQKRMSIISECQNIFRNCKTCNDGTPYELNKLKVHVKENHPELVLNCPYCQSCFIERYKFHNHIKAKHLKNKEDSAKKHDGEKVPILCEFCSRECKNKQSYFKHVNKIHLNPNDKPEMEKKIRQRFQLRERIQKRADNGFELQHCHV